MSVETAFYTAITGNGGINALIGTRLYPVRLPDDVTLPACAYWLVTTNVIGSGSTRCKQSRLQLDIYATTYSGAKAVRDTVESFIDGQTAYWYSVSPDAWEEESNLWHQPIDIFISH